MQALLYTLLLQHKLKSFRFYEISACLLFFFGHVISGNCHHSLLSKCHICQTKTLLAVRAVWLLFSIQIKYGEETTSWCNPLTLLSRPVWWRLIMFNLFPRLRGGIGSGHGASIERGLKRRGGTTLSLSPHHLLSPACRVNNPGAACSRWSLTEYQQNTLRHEKPLLHGKLSREPRQPHNSPRPDWRPALQDSLGKRECILKGIEKSKGVVGYRGQ